MRTPRGYASVEAVRLRPLPVLFWLGLSGYIALTALVAAGAVDAADRRVFDFCLDHHNSTIAAAADHFTNVLSPEADVAILLIGVGIRAWVRRRPAVVVPAILTVAVMAGIVLTTKNALGRPLPGMRHFEHAEGFPSGHTAMFLVCFGTLVLLTTRRHPRRCTALLTVVGIGTVLIAASLVYDGFHWATDTIASASLGAGLLSLLQSRLRRRTASQPSPTGTPPIGRSAHRH